VIAWLADDPGYLGGAELTQAEFANAAPREIVRLRPSEIYRLAGCETVVVNNCIQYPPETIRALKGRKVIRYHHDLSRAEHPELREWLERNATHIFTSPFHQQRYGLDGEWPNVPPALDLDSLRSNGSLNGSRSGTCSLAGWRVPGKGGQLLADWAAENGPVDVYGTGPCIPSGGNLKVKDMLEPSQVPQTLWQYERFVFLPFDPEPFCRSVVEAWAAGCRVVTNDLVGARHYIENDPEALETAAERFWDIVL
jgi:hypothetical protein